MYKQEKQQSKETYSCTICAEGKPLYHNFSFFFFKEKLLSLLLQKKLLWCIVSTQLQPLSRHRREASNDTSHTSHINALHTRM